MQTKIDYQEYLKSDYWKEIGGIPLFSCKSEIKKEIKSS